MSLMPLFPLNTVLFPGGLLPLRIFEPRYLDMVSRSLRDDSPFVISLLTSGSEVGEPARCEPVGVTVKIHDWDALPGELLGITVLAERIVSISLPREGDGNLLLAEVEYFPREPALPLRDKDRMLVELLRRILQGLPLPYSDELLFFDDAGWVANRLLEVLPFSHRLKQTMLQERDPQNRIERLHHELKKLELLI